jgi:hypothetical protein
MVDAGKYPAQQTRSVARLAGTVSRSGTLFMTHSTHGSRRKFLSASVGLGAMALLRDAGAQKAKWPVKPIRIVVTFPPGGLTDAYARMYAEQITASLGVPAIRGEQAWWRGHHRH